jgi:sugar (pentulose or hexulose) kinase
MRLGRDDFALLGDVLLAGRGLGIFADLKQAAQRYVKTTVSYEPDPDRHKTYEKYVRYYGSLFDKVRDIFTDLKHIESGTWTST